MHKTERQRLREANKRARERAGIRVRWMGGRFQCEATRLLALVRLPPSSPADLLVALTVQQVDRFVDCVWWCRACEGRSTEHVGGRLHGALLVHCPSKLRLYHACHCKIMCVVACCNTCVRVGCVAWVLHVVGATSKSAEESPIQATAF